MTGPGTSTGVVVQVGHGAAQGLPQVAHGAHELHVPQVPQLLHVPQVPQLLHGLHDSTMHGSATTTVCRGRQRPHHESRQPSHM